MPHLEPTQDAGRAFWQRGLAGPVVMLNLLRCAVADYSADPELAPATPISGAAAFDRYVAHTLPYLKESGGAVLFLGEGRFLIGPADELWDRAMLVRQSSVHSFMAFAGHTGYRAGLGHRTAALEDSRLLAPGGTAAVMTGHLRYRRDQSRLASGSTGATRPSSPSL